MKGGDLSNRSAPRIAFSLNCILRPKQKEQRSIKDKLLSFFSPILAEDTTESLFEIIPGNVSRINRLWRRTDWSFDLYAIDDPRRRSYLEDLLEGVGYSEIVVVRDVLELRDKLEASGALYYFDTDPETIAIVSTARVKALHFDELESVVG